MTSTQKAIAVIDAYRRRGAVALELRPTTSGVWSAIGEAPAAEAYATQAADQSWFAVTRAAYVLEEYNKGAPYSWMRGQLEESLRELENARRFAAHGGIDSLVYAIDQIYAAVGRALQQIGEGAGDGFEAFWGEKPATTFERGQDSLWWTVFAGGVFAMGALYLAPALVSATGGAALSVLKGQAGVVRAAPGLIKPLAAILR